MILLFLLLFLSSSVYAMESQVNVRHVSSKSLKEQIAFMHDIRSGSIGLVKSKLDRKKVSINGTIPSDAVGVEEWATNKLPLHLAIQQRQLPITTLLLASGAKLIPYDGIPLTHLAIVLALGVGNKEELRVALQMLDLMLAYRGSVTDKAGDTQETVMHRLARNMVLSNVGTAQKVFDHVLINICKDPKLQEEAISSLTVEKEKVEEVVATTACVEKVFGLFTLTNNKGETVLDTACAPTCSKLRHSQNCKRHFFTKEHLYAMYKDE